MARNIVVERDGAVCTFDMWKVDRAKLYGKRRRVPLDSDGEPCLRASLTMDGSLLVRSGMTAQGYFDEEGHWFAHADLVGLDPEGNPLDKVPTTLGVAQALHPATPQELLDLRLQTVYALEPVSLEGTLAEDLEAGEVFRFEFNYRADFQPEVAFLVANETGVFALVGELVEPEWCQLESAVDPGVDDEDDFDDDLDFEMF